MLLKDMDISVDRASGMAEALSMLEDGGRDVGKYQVILLDWNPAEGAGIRELSRIREVVPGELPVLLLTDYDAEGLDEALRVENTGTLFKPFFMSALKDKIQELRAGIQESGKADVENALDGMHFLAAEDNEINAEILQEVLSMENASCEIAENGMIALERFAGSSEGEFDAILMDVQMPIMNGYDATRAIRSLERKDAGTIPIIAMTANAFAEDEKEALSAGMNVHLAKPIDVELLKQVIKQYVKSKG